LIGSHPLRGVNLAGQG